MAEYRCVKCRKEADMPVLLAASERCPEGGRHEFAPTLQGLLAAADRDMQRTKAFRANSAQPVVYGLSPNSMYLEWEHVCQQPLKVLGLAIWVPCPSIIVELWAAGEKHAYNVDTRFFGLGLTFDELKPLADRGQLPSSLITWKNSTIGHVFRVVLRDARPNASMAIWGNELRE